MPRAFIAVPVEDEALAERLLAVRRQIPVPETRWVPRDQLHVTLKFLGPLTSERLAAVRDALPDAEAFDVTLEGLGVFPERGPARVLWVGCGNGSDALQALAARVEAAMVSIGLAPEERPFATHLTLARVKDPGPGREVSRLAGSLAPASFGALRVREIVVFTSVLSPSGPTYTAFARRRLAERAEDP